MQAVDIIQRIFDDDRRVDRLPAAVTSHFAARFLAPAALHQLPPLDVSHPPESHTRGTLVRFRAMIQDTSLQSEMYLAISNDRLPRNRLCSLGSLGAGRVSLAIHSGSSARSMYACAISPHKFPVPGAPHIGVRVKIYDSVDAENLHSADVVTFIGIISSEPHSVEDDSSPEVPVLHVLCCRVASANPTPTNFDATVRTDLMDWISREGLGGDIDAAEWLLLQLASKVYTRAVPLLPPSLTISCFPQPSSPELIPSLSHVLAELLPHYLFVPLSLDLLNKIPFLPESKEEDLHSGYLQLPHGSTILLTESAIQEGKLLEKGVINVRAIQNAMNSQTVDYIFPFSSRFTFNTDLSMIVLSEGRKSALFQTGISTPLRCTLAISSVYKQKDDISLPSAHTLTAYRSYIAACRAMGEKVQITEETSKHIQEDFVRWRQQDKSVTPDELIHLMKVARLLAASLLQDEVTIDIWERAKELDNRRQAR